MLSPRLAISIALALALSAASPVAAGEFVPCKPNRPDDAGLRVLVGTVFANDANARNVQRLLGQPETPVRGRLEDVDVLAWCRCVHDRRVRALGKEIAVSMMSHDPQHTALYDAWLRSLDPQRQREHIAFLFTADAVCVNESLRPPARPLHGM